MNLLTAAIYWMKMIFERAWSPWLRCCTIRLKLVREYQ